MASRPGLNYSDGSDSRSYPPSDRRGYTSGSEDSIHHACYPPERRSPPHDHVRSARFAPRGGPPGPDYSQPPSRYGQRVGYDDDAADFYGERISDHRRFRFSPPPRDNHRGGYRDRDREGYYSPHRRSRSRTRSRSPRRRDRDRSPLYSAPPSREVILDGLPADMTEQDIRSELEQYYHVSNLQAVRVIRDRKTGSSRGFGFLRFGEVRDAVNFIEENDPSIRLYGNDEGSRRVNIAFSREREDRERGSEIEWTCGNCSQSNYPRRNECFRCQAPRSQYEVAPVTAPAVPANTGDSDVALDETPSQFLLFRGLEPSVTEELLAKGVAKLYKSNERTMASELKKGTKVNSTANTNPGAQEGSILRVMIVRDRKTDESWRYGFAEYHSLEDAQTAIGKYNSVEKFTIASKPVMVSYIHTGVFRLSSERTGDIDRFSFTASSNPDVRLAYWDRNAYAREYMVSGFSTASDQPTKVDPGSKNAADVDSGKSAKEEGKAKKRKADNALGGSTKKVRSSPASQRSHNAELPLTPSPLQALPSHLQFWKDRHAEIHGIGSSLAATTADDDAGNGNASENSRPSTTSLSRKPKNNTSTNSPKTSHAPALVPSFTHPGKLCCYLCARKFKSPTALGTHERVSDLHAKNLLDADKRAAAVKKLDEAGLIKNDEMRTALLSTDAMPSSGGSPSIEAAAESTAGKRDAILARDEALLGGEEPSAAPEYRDRAKERRLAFNQPSKPKIGGGSGRPVAPFSLLPGKGGKTTVAGGVGGPQASGSSKPKSKEGSPTLNSSEPHHLQQQPGLHSSASPPKPAAKSKGASLLGKMGWSEGQGLGAQGREGMTAPVEAAVYAAGVGLGAEGAKIGNAGEVGERAGKGYEGWVEGGRERMRERFRGME